MPDLKERKHSKFSASGAERWFRCSGSIALSEGLPDTTNIYAEEGTRAHEVLETILRASLHAKSTTALRLTFAPDVPKEMVHHGMHAANHILKLFNKVSPAEIMVESRVWLDFIHPEAFGSLDTAIIEHFGTLHIADYKYGMSLVSPKENLQFLFYALAVAHKYNWNFRRVRMWTLQPRVRGFDGYVFWDIPIQELKSYIPKFREAIERVEKFPDVYTEGDHCYWCKAKSVCPLKTAKKLDQAIDIFKANKLGGALGQKESKEKSRQKEESFKSEAQWRKEIKAAAIRKRSRKTSGSTASARRAF